MSNKKSISEEVTKLLKELIEKRILKLKNGPSKIGMVVTK